MGTIIIYHDDACDYCQFMMLVLVIIAVATFRSNTFNIYPLKNFTFFFSFLHDVVIDFNPQQMNV